MKTNKKNLIRRIRDFIFLPILALALLFVYSHTLHSAESNNKMKVAQQEKVTVVGKITDNSNDAIDGVVVKDINSDTETVSDAEGKFTLLLNEPTVVSFTKFGFETLEKEVAEGDSSLVVILKSESNEVIVQGLGTEIIRDRDNKWILDSLSTIIDNYPLYVIDDIQKEKDFDIKMLDADEVLSIEILKDSIAKGVYGVDDESGVVKITTENYNKLMNETPLQLNRVDTTSISLKDKYEVYKDSMNARNDRLQRMRGKVLKNKPMMNKESHFPMDSVDRLSKKGGDQKMSDQMDTTTMKIKTSNKEWNGEWKEDTTIIHMKNIEEIQ